MRRLSRDAAVARAKAELASLSPEHHGCPICGLASGFADVEILAEGEHAVAALDRYPAREGHVVVASRRHVERVAELEENVWIEVQRLAHRAAVAIDRVLAPRRTFVAALGSAEALAISFPHVHVHVLPVPDDGAGARPASVLTWSAGVWMYEGDEAVVLAGRLRAAWP